MRLVPVWFQQKGTAPAFGSRVEHPFRFALLAAGLYFLYCLWLLPVLTDWVSFAVDEGFTAYAAKRFLEGDLPHRDFFFLWTPGIVWLHALLQSLGASWLVERGFALLASSGTLFLCLAWAKRLGLDRGSRVLLFLLLFVWGFSLWNIPYSSWYAVFFSLAASWFLPKRFYLAGFLLGLSFWFKQNIGLLALLGALISLFLKQEKKSALHLSLSAFAVIVIPLSAFAFAGSQAFAAAVSQIFLFPLKYKTLMAEPLPSSQLAAPLSCFGLWILSLYLVRKGLVSRSVLLIQGAWGAYALYRWQIDGNAFAAGSLYLFSLLAWPLAALIFFSDWKNKEKNELAFFFFPAFGAFLQVYPRWDFQHFLFVFPLAALLLVYGADWIAKKYPDRPRLWIHAPLIALFLCALLPQLRLSVARVWGQKDPYERISVADGLNLNREMHDVADFLRAQGLQKGGPLLVFPNANYFYALEGFTNPTPHNQFFPGYVEAYGDKQENVLRNFELAGGRFLVLQKRSGTEKNVPIIYTEILERYRLLRDYPIHFSVWERKP